MLADSHCHLNMLDLSDFNQSLDEVIASAKTHEVTQLLCVSVELKDYNVLRAIAEKYDEVLFSTGVHPCNDHVLEGLYETLYARAMAHPKCIAIGETGLDYYRTNDADTIRLQQESFRQHIEVSKQTKKPLIIHTRSAADDTLRLMQECQADTIGGVMHCFAENWDVAQRAMDLNFYISFSGIVTFKNARDLQEVAQKTPLDRMLIETDAPYLAPTPYRGKQNQPAYVKYVAEKIAELRGDSYENIAKATTNNFLQCFRRTK